MKRRESENQRSVNALRADYEAITNFPLSVIFVGDISVANSAKIVPAIVAEGLASKPIGYHVTIDPEDRLRVYITRAFRAEWFSVNDRVGWVDRNPILRIADAIELKSKNLPRYEKIAGSDIRLLLVADRTSNSGKLKLEKSVQVDRKGFKLVYFLSYPETVTVFDRV